MTIWLIAIAAFSCTGLGVLIFYLRMRRRKQERLELRLLAGRGKLIGEELDYRLKLLQTFDQEELAALRQEAENALDQLQVALVERQAHLLNYEDLAHLQQCKIDILGGAREDLEDVPSLPAVEPAPAPSPPGKDRTQLEDELLEKISKLRQDKTRRNNPSGS